jgi:hypothetical protein
MATLYRLDDLPAEVALRIIVPPDELAARRELRSWIAATEWLNARGYAAAVPSAVAGPLMRRGLVVWGVSHRDAA